MIEFMFSMKLTKIPYTALVHGNGDILFVIGAQTAGLLPVWLQEHLANTITAQLDHDPHGRTSNIIDLTEARALRMAPVQVTAT